MRRIWARYLEWRNSPPPKKPVAPREPEVVKVDVDETAATMHKYSNRGGGSGGGPG